MLTGDKGKTAKMIGVQCGMFSSKIDRPSEKQNKEIKSPSAVGQIDLDINKREKSTDGVKLYEVNEKVQDVHAEIMKILELSAQQSENSKLELLIDGGVFAKMLTAQKETLKQLNDALNSAAAVIIYRASPK